VSRSPRESLFLDANVFLRFLTGDDPAKASACKELFERAERRELDLHTNELILAELAWTLKSFYRRPREEILGALQDIADLKNLHLPRKRVIVKALELYQRFNVDFVDAYNAADMEDRGIKVMCSYDKDYDRIDVPRLAPGEG
jgi:predicted nucleic acid-binding protein